MRPVGPGDDTIADASYTAETAAAVPALVAGRYQILRWLGGGGMGRVYEVVDTELGERIALKMLRGDLTDEALERFRREVKLTRRIQHPNVARMFDIGEIDGDRYLTMELVDGESLASQLGQPMPWPKLRDVAIQICAGLAAAHDKGVVHRDLKPDNVLVESATGRIVLTDFGIARSVDDANVTQTGMIIGTPRYMAPEQLAGQVTDPRADLFSLGVMLYELASNARPWSGDNAITIAVAQATQPMRPLPARGLPHAFVRLVESLLAVDREHRPESVAAVGAALAAMSNVPVEEIGDVAATPTHPLRPVHDTATTIAVLAFAASPGDDYIADGMREDLIDMLSTTRGLHVRPAGTIDVRGIDPRQAGIELAVDHVVVGSVRRTPAGLRVAARLIGVADGFQIWAHRIDCSDAQVLEIGDQLGKAIATALSTRAAHRHALPTDPKAVELYLRARAEMRRFWGDHVKTATTLLEEAAEIAPSSAPIAGLLACTSVTAWAKLNEPALLVKARQYIERGLALDHPEAVLASANLHWNLGDIEASARDLRVALDRAPMSALAHEMAGRLLIEIDPGEAARHHFETSIALDPTRLAMVASDVARLDVLAGNWEAADRRLALLYEDPDPAVRQYAMMVDLRLAVWRRDVDKTLRTLELMEQRFSRLTSSGVALVRLVNGWKAGHGVDETAWQQVIAISPQPDRPKRVPLSILQRATEIAMMLEAPDKAIESLRRAADYGLVDIVWIDRCPVLTDITDPQWRALRDEVATRASRVLAVFRGARPPATTLRGVSGSHVGRR